MRTKKLNSRALSLNFSLQTLRRSSPQFSSPLSSFIHQQPAGIIISTCCFVVATCAQKQPPPTIDQIAFKEKSSLSFKSWCLIAVSTKITLCFIHRAETTKGLKRVQIDVTRGKFLKFAVILLP